MSGHNKWTQIKRKKAVVDAARGSVFAKHSKSITNEVRISGGNIDAASVRATIERAQKDNMPKDAIERAVQKGLGIGGPALTTVLYELFGPGGVAILVRGSTDNNNRTVNEIKHLVSEHGYTLGTPNSAQWAFVKTEDGYTPLSPITLSEEDSSLLEILVLDIEAHDDIECVFTNALAISP